MIEQEQVPASAVTGETTVRQFRAPGYCVCREIVVAD